jgi:hypothetical protein
MLRRVSLSLICGLLLFLGGCPKRQATQSVLVYVPAPVPPPVQVASSAPSAANPQVLVIEEPPPPPEPEPEPEEIPPPQTPEPTARRKAKHPARSETSTDQDEAPATENPETPGTPPAEVPALEPRQSSAQQNELRRQFMGLQQDIGKRLERLSSAHLSANDQKTLEDARTFFQQANQAMASGDLPRALNLAHKAGLLLAALE